MLMRLIYILVICIMVILVLELSRRVTCGSITLSISSIVDN